MNKIVIFIALLAQFSYSQSLFDEYDSFKPFGSKNEVSLSHLKQWGYDDIFLYNENELIQHKDSINILHKIEYVSIKLEKSTDLSRILRHLSSLPNLTYLQFHNLELLRDPVSKIAFSEQIKELKTLRTIDFYGFFDWDYQEVFNILSELPLLKNLMIRGAAPSSIMEAKNITVLERLEGLWISGHKGPIIPEDIGELDNLKNLIISCDIYPKGSLELRKLKDNQNLENLVLANFEINDSIASSLASFRHLKRVNLAGPITDPQLTFEHIGKNNEISELVLSNNEMKEIPPAFIHLTNLKSFYSSNNRFRQLPTEFYSLKKLESIEIQGSYLEVIDEQINQLSELRILKLFYNKIKQFPKNLSNIDSLKVLWLEHNDLTELDANFETLTNLEILNLKNNRLTSLPESVVELKKLDSLWLENNYIREFPDRFGNLASLKYLNAEGNLLQSLPGSIGNLSNLRYLNLNLNDLKTLPKSIGGLQNLNELYLKANLLEDIPESLSKLKKLTNLNLNSNNLKSLPSEMGSLSSLKILDLGQDSRNPDYTRYDHNLGKFIPDTVYRPRRQTNDLRVLPSSISRLKNLKFLDLSNNKNLDIDSLFRLIRRADFSNYNLRLEGCNINTLPQQGWSEIKAKHLNLDNNFILELPEDIRNNSSLETLSIRSRSPVHVDTYRGNKTEISVLLEEHDIIPLSELKKTPELAKAMAKVANNSHYKKNFNKSLKYASKAIEIDSATAFSALYIDNYIETLFKLKEYNSVIEFAESEIKKDTSQNIRILNYILPNLRYKAMSHLELGDTINAIQDYKTLSSRFNENHWALAGLLSYSIGQDSISNIYARRSITAYEKILENTPSNWGAYFSLIESHIIAGNYGKAKLKLRELKRINLPKGYQVLYDYFQIIIDLILEEEGADILFNNFIRNKVFLDYNLKNWSFKLFNDWIQLNGHSTEVNSQISELTELLSNQI